MSATAICRRSSGRIALILCCLWLPLRAEAGGSGVYFEHGNSSGEFDDSEFDADFDNGKLGVGLVFDTNVSQDRLFNFRFSIGYQHTERDFDGDLDRPVDSDGLALNGIFGLGLYRSPRLRVWAGPSIRLNADVLDEDALGGNNFATFGVGGGPAFGVNLHQGDRLSIGLAFAYQYLYLQAITDSDAEGTEYFEGDEHLGTLNLLVLFRSAGDRF